jgi:hypothetical protein
MSSINVNTINEYTGANGVTIDGVKLKDNAVETDTISEKTSAAGVTIDGALIKDNFLSATAGGGLVKLTSGTASSSSALTFDNFVDDTLYSQYNIVLRQMIPATDNTNLMFRFRKGGASGSDVTGSYFQSGAYYYGDAASSGFETNISNSNSAAVIALGSTANETMSGEMVLYTGGGNSNGVVGKFYRKNPFTNLHGQDYAVGMGQSDVVTGLQFFMASGNIASGEITIYGMRK